MPVTSHHHGNADRPVMENLPGVGLDGPRSSDFVLRDTPGSGGNPTPYRRLHESGDCDTGISSRSHWRGIGGPGRSLELAHHVAIHSIARFRRRGSLGVVSAPLHTEAEATALATQVAEVKAGPGVNAARDQVPEVPLWFPSSSSRRGPPPWLPAINADDPGVRARPWHLVGRRLDPLGGERP